MPRPREQVIVSSLTNRGERWDAEGEHTWLSLPGRQVSETKIFQWQRVVASIENSGSRKTEAGSSNRKQDPREAVSPSHEPGSTGLGPARQLRCGHGRERGSHLLPRQSAREQGACKVMSSLGATPGFESHLRAQWLRKPSVLCGPQVSDPRRDGSCLMGLCPALETKPLPQ